MKTAEEIIKHLEAELSDAFAEHEHFRGKDAQQALGCLIKAITIQELLDEIK